MPPNPFEHRSSFCGCVLRTLIEILPGCIKLWGKSSFPKQEIRLRYTSIPLHFSCFTNGIFIPSAYLKTPCLPAVSDDTRRSSPPCFLLALFAFVTVVTMVTMILTPPPFPKVSSHFLAAAHFTYFSILFFRNKSQLNTRANYKISIFSLQNTKKRQEHFALLSSCNFCCFFIFL